jgi:mRNA interferase RelE/StbE
MEQYKVYIKRSAGKELGRIREKDRKKIIEKIRSLSFEPRPVGVKKLSGEEKYRVRQGDYRILYKIEAEIVTVTVVRIAHRREVYR